MRSQARGKRRWSWSYLYMAWSPAWSRDVAVERLYPVTPQRVRDSRLPDSWCISYSWNINNNYRSVPWAVLSPCTYFLCSKHMTMSCWHIGMTYCQWCHALEVESRCNIRSYCIFMGRGGRVFFFLNSHSLLLCAWLLGEYSKFPQVLLSAITQKSSFVLRLCWLLSLYFSSQLWSEPFPSVGLVCTDVGFTPLETVIFLLPVLSGGGSS